MTFDDIKNVEQFSLDPEKFMNIYQNKIIFDEVQNVPELFNYIKIAVDNDRQNYGKFILTGSSQFAFLKKVSESLAGRIGLLTLLPFQYSEMPKKSRKKSIFRGSYPELVNRDYQSSNPWYSSYINTYLSRDVRTLSNIVDMRDFQRLISLLAANTSQTLNMSQYANDLGVSVQTIKNWISVLEASYIIFLLPPFYKNYGKRITKRPKIFFYDTGLVSYLTGISTQELYEKGPMAGSIFENYVISEVLKQEIHGDTNSKLYYYRTTSGEVDLIIDRKTHKEFIEIRSSATFRPQMIAAVEQLTKKTDKGYLLYNGKKVPY